MITSLWLRGQYVQEFMAHEYPVNNCLKKNFDLAIWQFFLCYEENMRFSASITIIIFQARNFCSSFHRR